MAERLFSKVSPAIWTSGRFRGLSANGRLYYLYLLTNAHIDSTGCYRLPDAYACADCGIDADTHKAVTAELIAADMIAIDNGYVLVKRWFKHNPPTNLDYAEGVKRRIALIESDVLREECEAAFIEAEAALNDRLERIAQAKADKALRAKLRIAHSQDSSVASPFGNSDLTRTRYMNGGARS